MRNKYTCRRIIQQNFGYGHGWEDVDEVDSEDDERNLMQEYRLMGYPVRCITRRVPNEEQSE